MCPVISPSRWMPGLPDKRDRPARPHGSGRQRTETVVRRGRSPAPQDRRADQDEDGNRRGPEACSLSVHMSTVGFSGSRVKLTHRL